MFRVAGCAGALVFVIVLGRYLVSRIASPWNATRLRTLEPVSETQAAQAVQELRIGTFNIAHGRGTAASNWGGGDRATRLARLREIARLLRDQRLDVAVLNEVDFSSVWSGHVNQAEFIARAAGFPFWVEQRNFDATIPFCSVQFGNAVLSLHPLSDVELVDLPAYSQFESALAGKKKAVLCTLKISADTSVRLLAVHLEHRTERVRVQSARLIDRICRESELPVIVAGDLNSSPLEYPLVEVDDSGESAVALLLQQGGFAARLDARPGPDEFTFHSLRPDRVIDWILVKEPWKIVSKKVPPAELSDHRPVIARIIKE